MAAANEMPTVTDRTKATAAFMRVDAMAALNFPLARTR
jgi:hypothetical protein